jgi:hypothetical protein
MYGGMKCGRSFSVAGVCALVASMVLYDSKLWRALGGFTGTEFGTVITNRTIARSEPSSFNNSNSSTSDLASTGSNMSVTWKSLNISVQNVSNTSRFDKASRPRVAYITYSSFPKGMEWRFHMYVADALRTWLTEDVLYLVLTPQWKEKLASMCSMQRDKVCDRVKPIYVDCPEGYYGESPCCKYDKGLSYMANNHGYDYDWFIYHDDDMYFRTQYMREYLKGLSHDQPVVLSSRPIKVLGFKNNCKSDDPHYNFPAGQPAVLSRAALWFIKPGLEAGGLTKQCLEFDISHDVGNAVFHWMYGLPEVHLPPLLGSPPPTFPESGNEYDVVGIHGIGRIGNVLNTTEIHAKLRDLIYPKPPYDYKWHNALGFLKTKTYRLHGNASQWGNQWHTMPVSDCQGSNATHDPVNNSTTE